MNYKDNYVAKFEKVSFNQCAKDWAKHMRYTEKQSSVLYDLIKLPQRGTSESAGYDFYTPFHIVLEPKKTITIPTGIRCNIKNGWFLSIVPRSGHGFKYGLRIINTIGIIDSDYYNSDNEGHIMIKLINDSSVYQTVDIPFLQGFAQGIFMPYGLTVDDSTTATRNGGFGSTNTN